MLAGEDTFSIGLTGAIAFVICVLVFNSRLSGAAQLIVCAGLALRFAGAYVRQLFAADAHTYFEWGNKYAVYFSQLDPAPFLDDSLWRSTNWFGTNFMGYLAGIVITLIGSSWLGVFFFFSLLSFGGIWAFAQAFRRSFPGVPYYTYWAWIFLMPSLWFWPSSIGKEAIMMLGLGIATLGYAGKHGRINWILLCLGLAIAFCIRPQVVAVFLFAVTLASWLQFDAWTPQKAIQGISMLILGLIGMWFAMATTLGGEVELSSFEEYVQTNASRNDSGGSSVEAVGTGPAAIPLSIINVLFRPFPWEAHNLQALVAAGEIVIVWGLIWYRRRELAAALAMWRQHRMLRFAIPFVCLYVVGLGMNLSNLGLVARQRVLVYPFLFLIVEAGVYFRSKAGTTQPKSQRSGQTSKVKWPAGSLPGELRSSQGSATSP